MPFFQGHDILPLFRMSYLSLIRLLCSPFTKEHISKVPVGYGVYLLMAEGGSEGDGIIYYVGAAGYGGPGRTLRNRLLEHFRAQNRDQYKKDSNSRFNNHTRKYGLHTASFLVLKSYKRSQISRNWKPEKITGLLSLDHPDGYYVMPVTVPIRQKE